MDLSFVTEYISPIILVFCIGLGYLIHSRKNEIYDSFIPIIVAVVGILAAI